ncbi:DNRLRE domain-containing protein [Paenibacillus sp. J5C_2022]|nr:DNRLRE domain-containing protein [Paenibacillus sp. J5C2022]
MQILPLADTYLNSGSNANQNYGTDPTLQVRTWAGDDNYTRESYMKFDLSGYEGEIGSAKLNLYAKIVNPNGSPYNFQLYGSGDDSWEEEMITWSYKPTLDHYLANVNVGLAWKWIEVDVTSFVKAQMASDKVASFGLSQHANSGALIHIYSKENGAYQPYLSIAESRVDASAPAWPEGSSVQVTQMNAEGIRVSWSEAEGSDGVTGYRVYENGKLVATVNDTTWHREIAESDMDKTFTYKIEAGNGGNHWSNDGPYLSAAIPSTQLEQTRIGNVFLDNEPVQFQVATLRPDIAWSVYNMQGDRVSQGSAVNENGSTIIEVPFAGYGYFTFRASVGGEGLEPIELMTSFAVLSPFDISEVEESPFGMATHLHRGQKDTVPLIQYAGAKTIRDGIEWRVLEKTKGEYDFSPVPDDYMADLNQYGLNMLFVSGFNNPYYDNNATPYTDDGREGFANYVEAYIEQYSDQLIAAEAYNEFNGGFGKRGNSPANSQPEYYYKLLKKTYETVKAQHPDFPVIGIVASEDAMDWIEEVFKLGGLQYMDAVSIHPYRYPDSPEGLADSVEEIKALIRQYNNGELMPIWATEFGYPTFQSTRGVDELTQANYMVRYYAIALASGIEKTFWYDLVNDGVRIDYNEDNFGMLRNAADPMGSFTPKPAYAAYAAMTRELTGAEFVMEESIGGDIKSYVFDQSGNRVRTVWSLSPVNAAILTEDPIQIVDMMGNSNTYTPYRGRVYVSLNGEPLYVKGDIQGIEENSMFAVHAEEAVAGEQVLFSIQANNTASSPADFTLLANGGTYDIHAGSGQPAELTVTVDGLEEPGTRLFNGTIMYGNDRIGLLRDGVAVGPASEIHLRPVLNSADGENKSLTIKVTNLSKRNELHISDADWQLGDYSGHVTINQSVPPDSSSLFDIPLENIVIGQSYPASVTVKYGGNKLFTYAGNIAYHPIYAETVLLDGIPDSQVTARPASIDLSGGTVRVSGYGGADDLSGEVWLNYDRDNLYLTAEIKDDTFAFPASGKDIWNNDSIQFAISNGLPAEDVNYYEYGISQTPDGPQIYRWLTPSGVASGPVTDGALHVTRDEEQHMTRYELALPWTELLPVDLHEGVISFSLLVNENDGGLRRGWVEWGSGIGDGKAPGKFLTMQWVRESTVLEMQPVSGVYSDAVWLQASLKAGNGTPLADEWVGFLVDGDLKGTALTDEQGIARLEYTIDQGASADSDSRSVTVKAVYDGDDTGFYKKTEADGTLVVNKEQGTVTCTYSIADDGSGMLTLQAQVHQEMDGSYGSLEHLPIQWQLSRINPDGTLSPVPGVVDSVYETNADGSISIAVQLPAGLYDIRTRLINNLYYQSAEQSTIIGITGGTSGKLRVNGFIEPEDIGEFMGDKAKKIHMNIQSGGAGKKDKVRIHAEPQGLDITLDETDWMVIADDGSSAYVQGEYDANGELQTLRLTVQARQDGEGYEITLQIWPDRDTTAAPVYQSIGVPLSGSADITEG